MYARSISHLFGLGIAKKITPVNLTRVYTTDRKRQVLELTDVINWPFWYTSVQRITIYYWLLD